MPSPATRFATLPLASPPAGGKTRLLFMCGAGRSASYNLGVVERFERATHVVRLDQPDCRGAYRSLRPAGGQRNNHRPENLVTPEYEAHDHDVLIIGAGGAGLRAALGALAEGGIAAAMANVDSTDDWRTHFRDTMRGGKLLNNWRMAQIHAQEAPERVRELELWGALFDRTPDGQILQRAFGGHTFRRLCPVGDRTGLEMIRTLLKERVVDEFYDPVLMLMGKIRGAK